MKAAPPPLQIGKPCPKSWDSLSGDGKRRFCEHCQLHVHNLSAMSSRERNRFVAESGGRACIAYRLRPDGTLITPSVWRNFSRHFGRLQVAAMAVLSAVLPFLFSACSQRRHDGSTTPPAHLHSAGQKDQDCQITLGVPMPPPPAASAPKSTSSTR